MIIEKVFHAGAETRIDSGSSRMGGWEQKEGTGNRGHAVLVGLAQRGKLHDFGLELADE